MQDADSVMLKKLYDKVMGYEKKGFDINHIIETLGFEVSSVLPIDNTILLKNNPSQDIIKLRIEHHNNKCEKILRQVLEILKKSKTPLQTHKKISQDPPKVAFMFSLESKRKESIDLQFKRRTEASERAMKLKFEQKFKLLKKIKEKETKSTEQKQKALASIKEKIDKFQSKEQTKYMNAKQNLEQGISRSPRIRKRECRSEIPTLDKTMKSSEKSFMKIIDSDDTEEKLMKFDEKMYKAKERYNKIIVERKLIGKQRSQTVAKIRIELEKKKQKQDELLYLNLMEINENIENTKSRKEENLYKMISKRHQSSSARIPKSITDEFSNSTDLERHLIMKDKKNKQKIELLKNQYSLNVSLKREKYKLALSDIMEKRDVQTKIRLNYKNKILDKHIKTSQAFEVRKNLLTKFEQQVREREYHLSQSFAKHKHSVIKEIQELEAKNSILITS